MTRISTLRPDQLPDDIREQTNADERTPLERGPMRIYAHRPELARGLMAFSRAMRTDRILDDRLTELVRLRVAYFNQCRSCMAIRYPDAIADGLTEDLVCSLERPDEAPDLSERERAALVYADRFSTDHHSIGEADFAALREHFTEPEIVELGMQLALFVGFGRLAATWDMVDDLPEHYRDKSADADGRTEWKAPWDDAEPVVVV